MDCYQNILFVHFAWETAVDFIQGTGFGRHVSVGTEHLLRCSPCVAQVAVMVVMGYAQGLMFFHLVGYGIVEFLGADPGFITKAGRIFAF